MTAPLRTGFPIRFALLLPPALAALALAPWLLRKGQRPIPAPA